MLSNKYGKVAEDLTDSVEMKKVLCSCSDAELLPQALLKSPHVSCTYLLSIIGTHLFTDVIAYLIC